MKIRFNEIFKSQIIKLLIIFSFFAILFWLILPMLPPSSFWFMLLIPAIVWFYIELKNNWKDRGRHRIKKALVVGIVLVVFNLVINYNGSVMDIYTISSQYSLLLIYGSPIELLLLSFFGATAWFLHLHKKPNLLRSIIDVIILSSLGTIAELFILSPNNLMTYINVVWPDPFLTYAIVWSSLHFVYYKVLE